jgi:hypothetical protein
MADYTIRFYRHPEWAERFARAGILKPAGMATSKMKYTEHDAKALALYINRFKPDEECEVVRV